MQKLLARVRRQRARHARFRDCDDVFERQRPDARSPLAASRQAFDSPSRQFQAFNFAKVSVARNQCQIMLKRNRRDPNVIFR